MSEPNIVETWERFVRYYRTTTKSMDQHLQDAVGHSLEDYDVLHQVGVHDGPIRMGDLAERLLVANSSCHRIVGRLVDAEFLERSHGESDGRVVLVNLTAMGRQLRRRMAVVHARDINAHLGVPLTAREASRLDEVLQHLLAGRVE